MKRANDERSPQTQFSSRFTALGPFLCYRESVHSLDFGPFAHFTVAIVLRARDPSPGVLPYGRNGVCVVYHDQNGCDRLVVDRIAGEAAPQPMRPSARQQEQLRALQQMSLVEFADFCRQQPYTTPRFKPTQSWMSLLRTTQAAQAAVSESPASPPLRAASALR